MTLTRLERTVCCLVLSMAIVLAFGSSVATEAFWAPAAGAGPDIDAAFARFWKARPATRFEPPAHVVAQPGIGDLPPDQPGAIVGRQNPVGLRVIPGTV